MNRVAPQHHINCTFTMPYGAARVVNCAVAYMLFLSDFKSWPTFSPSRRSVNTQFYYLCKIHSDNYTYMEEEGQVAK